jgi:putative ABC transport system substrate-binding protein
MLIAERTERHRHAPIAAQESCVSMKRRNILFGFIAAGILGAVSLARSQAARSAHRIGYLSLRAGPGPLDEEFLAALRGLGYAEGRNLTIEYRWAADSEERLPALAKELARLSEGRLLGDESAAALAAREVDKALS